MPIANVQNSLKLSWREMMSDYVTAIAWTSEGDRLAACSACGEVTLFDAKTGEATVLQSSQGASLDALSISHDGKFLAAAGQAGTVTIWQIDAEVPRLLKQLTYSRVWIDRLRWNPCSSELAFSLGRYAQVWDAPTQTIVTTLNFSDSSILDLAWHPQGESLSVSGNQNIKTWQRQDWDEDPEVRETGGAGEAIVWSPDGRYLASGNNDRSVLVWEEGNLHPWKMRGFPYKVKQLAWSTLTTGAPILASTSGEGILTWTKDADPYVGWNAQVIEKHSETVTAIAFKPDSKLLASAAEDGRICLWNKANQMTQTLQGAPKGFSTLSWNSQGTALAAAGQQGEVLVWKMEIRGKGFG